jgi:MATE family multidrug resistance protein
MAINLIDSAMVSQLSYYNLAAASLVNNLIGLPFVVCIGFTVAIAPLVAELRGSQKPEACGTLLNNALVLNLAISLLLVVPFYLGGDVIFHLRQDPEVARLGRPYLNWMLWSIVPMTAFLSIKQFCDGLQHTRVPMLLSLASIPLNAGLNYLFIYGKFGFPALGLEGAGIATLLARLLVAVAIGIYVFKNSTFSKYRLIERSLVKATQFKIARLALPSAWQYCSEIGAFVLLGIVVGWFGPVQQAAHQISLSVAAMAFMVSIGLSSAGSIRVGEAYGMGNSGRVRSEGVAALKLAMVYGFFCAVCFIVFRNWIPRIFTEESAVIHQSSILFCLAAAFQIGDSLQAVGMGILRGVQDIRMPTLYTTLCYWFLGIPAGYFLGVVAGWEVTGVWVGFILCLSFMGVLLLRRFIHISTEKVHEAN